MNKAYLVYQTDVNHSYDSRNLIGVATTPESAIVIIVDHTLKFGGTINYERLEQLRTIQQTQGYNGVGEFQFEEVETDAHLGS